MVQVVSRVRFFLVAALAVGGAFTALILLNGATARAAGTCTIYWTGASSTGWNTNANWSTSDGGASAGRTPTTTDVVCMSTNPVRTTVVYPSQNKTYVGLNFTNPTTSLEIQGGTLTVNTNAGTINTLTFDGGTLAGSAPMSLTGAVSFPSGAVTFLGAAKTVASGATLTATAGISVGGTTSGQSGSFVNAGTATLTATTVGVATSPSAGAASSFANTGSLTLKDGTSLFVNGSGAKAPVTTNSGTLTSSGSSPASIYTPFTNTGTVAIGTAGLVVGAGNAAGSTDTGTWSTGSNATATLVFNAGVRAVTAGSFTGTTGLAVQGGATTFSAGVTISNLALSGGSIGGTVSIGNFTATSSGTITGPGTVTTTGTSTVCGLSIDGGKLTNQGTLTVDSSNTCYYWLFQNASTFTNATGATFAVIGDGTFGLIDNGGAVSRIVNAGTTTVALTASDDTVDVSVSFANTGAMNATTGHLRLTGGGIASVPDTGSYSGTATSSIDLAAGTRTATTVSGPGPLTISGGTNTFSSGTIGAVDLTGGSLGGTVSIGNFTATLNGTITGPGTVTTTGTSTVCGLSIDGSTLVNQGTLTQNTDSACYYWLFTNTARFTNAVGATFAVIGNGTFNVLDNGGNPSSIVNDGSASVTLTAATDSTTMSVPFTNNGSLTAVRGTVVLPTVTNLSGAGVLTGGTWNAPTGTITLPITVTTNAATVSIGTTGQVLASSTGTEAFAPLATNSGSFTIARSLTLTSAALANSGTLTVAAATLVVPSLTQSAGTTTVAAGATLNAGTAQVRINGGTLTGAGTVRGAVSGAGTVSPGSAGAGTLTVTGTVNTTAGTTLAVTEAAAAGTVVTASGAINVDATKLVVTTTGAPAIGTVRTVISGSARTGTVASLTGVDVPASGGYWQVGYTPTAVTLTLVAYPNASVANVTVAEGNSGTSTATFTVTLSAASPVAATVNYATANGTATAGSDYTATSGTLTFAAGVTSQTFPVTILGDTLYEADETFGVQLTGGTGVTTATNGTGTITNDDVAPSLSVGDAGGVTSAAGGGSVIFPVTLSAASGLGVTVSYATTDGTATAPGDYTATSGTLTIPAGSTSASITVPLTSRSTYAPPKTFTLTLSNPTGATISDGTAVGTITNANPNGPTVSGVTPGQGAQGVAVPVTINGAGFGAGSTVAVSGTGVTVSGTTVVNATTITATFSSSTTAAVGARNVTVTSGGLSNTCSACFTVVARPLPTGVDHPNLAIGNIDVVLTVSGSQFQPGADVVLVSGVKTIPATSTTTNSSSSITAVLSVPRGNYTGSWNVQVVNPDGGKTSCQGCVTIYAAPTLTGVSPSTLARGTTTSVTFTGTGFVSGAVVSVPGAQLSNVVVVSPTTITATVRVPATAATGARTVKVINPASAGSGSGQKATAITVT